MDYQNRVGHKMGGGGPASAAEANLERKERLKQLALEKINLAKDPYIMKNHVGQFECKLCLTIHPAEASYLAHTQGRKHQTNLAKRAARLETSAGKGGKTEVRQNNEAVGKPAYRLHRLKAKRPGNICIYVEVDFPYAKLTPMHRFMSAFEQKIENPPDPNFQFLLFAADSYITIGFKIPNYEILIKERTYNAHWNERKKRYALQFEMAPRTTPPTISSS